VSNPLGGWRIERAPQLANPASERMIRPPRLDSARKRRINRPISPLAFQTGRFIRPTELADRISSG
jgi:hypothetical protein